MTEQRNTTSEFEQLDRLLRASAVEFRYPPTPNIAAGVGTSAVQRMPRGRQLAWALVVLLVIATSLLAVPSVRARLLDFLQIGAIRIAVPEATSTAAEPLGAVQIPVTATPGLLPTITATPDYSSYLVSPLDLRSETTLEEARQQVTFPIHLPTYPADLGQPDRVYHEQLGTADFVVLAWLEPGTEDQLRISLYILGNGVTGFKSEPRVLERIEINGRPAIWTDGPHFFQLPNGPQPGRLVVSPVLIWEGQDVTYRLEADLLMEEMIRMAESIEP